LPAIERSAAKCFAGHPDLTWITDDTVMTVGQHKEGIRHGLVWVAEQNGKPVGFLAAQPFGHDLYIKEMAVAQPFQRQGIGSALLRFIQLNARQNGFQTLTLTTFRDVPWNAPFYMRQGFHIVTEPAPYLCRLLDEEEKRGLKREMRVAMLMPLTFSSSDI